MAFISIDSITVLCPAWNPLSSSSNQNSNSNSAAAVAAPVHTPAIQAPTCYFENEPQLIHPCLDVGVGEGLEYGIGGRGVQHKISRNRNRKVGGTSIQQEASKNSGGALLRLRCVGVGGSLLTHLD